MSKFNHGDSPEAASNWVHDVVASGMAQKICKELDEGYWERQRVVQAELEAQLEAQLAQLEQVGRWNNGGQRRRNGERGDKYGQRLSQSSSPESCQNNFNVSNSIQPGIISSSLPPVNKSILNSRSSSAKVSLPNTSLMTCK